jgi:hypothetical protein
MARQPCPVRRIQIADSQHCIAIAPFYTVTRLRAGAERSLRRHHKADLPDVRCGSW